MYIKIRPYFDYHRTELRYEFCILAANNVMMCLSDGTYDSKAEAATVAKKLAKKFNIEYRENN